jgi:hypothetical protein
MVDNPDITKSPRLALTEPMWWPDDLPGLTFLARCVDQVGRRFFPGSWTGKEATIEEYYCLPKLADATMHHRHHADELLSVHRRDLERGNIAFARHQDIPEHWRIAQQLAEREFKEASPVASMRLHVVRAEIIRWLRAGDLPLKVCHVSGGPSEEFQPGWWDRPRPERLFYRCTIDPDDPFDRRPNPKRDNDHYIYASREALDRIAMSVAAQEASAAKVPASEEEHRREGIREEELSEVDLISLAIHGIPVVKDAAACGAAVSEARARSAEQRAQEDAERRQAWLDKQRLESERWVEQTVENVRRLTSQQPGDTGQEAGEPAGEPAAPAELPPDPTAPTNTEAGDVLDDSVSEATTPPPGASPVPMDTISNDLKPEFSEEQARADLIEHPGRTDRALAKKWGWPLTRAFRFRKRIDAETPKTPPKQPETGGETPSPSRESKTKAARPRLRRGHPETWNWEELAEFLEEQPPFEDWTAFVKFGQTSVQRFHKGPRGDDPETSTVLDAIERHSLQGYAKIRGVNYSDDESS